MSKRTRGGTREANKRRERHARKLERHLPDVWQVRQRHGGRIGKALGCVRGRDCVLAIDGQAIHAVSTSTLDWHT
jgi:hypothetical protein